MNPLRESWGWMRPISEAFARRFRLIFTVLTVASVLAASTIWILDHPYGTGWDEAQYINCAHHDVAAVKEGDLLVFGRWARDKPPAYRLFLLPITLTLGVTPATLRFVSLAFLLGTLLFVYLAAQQIADKTAGAFAVIVVGLCPTIIAASQRFGTEFPLYLAISAMLYFLFRQWNNSTESCYNWIGLGLAFGLGALSKTSFLAIAIPVFTASLLLSWRKAIAGPTLQSLMKAAGLGTLLALPWWWHNYRFALGYARRAGAFARHSLGPPGPVTWGQWLEMFANNGLGLGITILVAAVLLTICFRRISKKRPQMNPRLVSSQWICWVGAVPLLLTHMLGINHNPRLLSPALIPLAIGVAALAATAGWTRARLLVTIAAGLFILQLVTTIAPVTGHCRRQGFPGSTEVMCRWEQWNWDRLYNLCQSYAIKEASIAYLGHSPSFNPPQISYPWIKRGEQVDVERLWRYEEGTVNWQEIMASVANKDIIITAPGLIGSRWDKQDIDNRHNAEFAERMRDETRFSAPIRLTMGPSEPLNLLVFMRTPESK